MKKFLVIAIVIVASISSAVSRSIIGYDDYDAEFLEAYYNERSILEMETYGGYPVDISRAYEDDMSSFVTFVPLYDEVQLFDTKIINKSDENNEVSNDDDTTDDAGNTDGDDDNEDDNDSGNKSNDETVTEDDMDLSDDNTTAVSENNENIQTLTSAIGDDQGILLQKLSSSSLNSKLLANAFADNAMDLKAAFEDTESSLWFLLRQNINVYEEFYTTAHERSDYDGQKHRKLMADMTEMLTKVDEVRMQIQKMQSIGQRLNYHQLLKALLKEIYGENKLLL